MFSNFRTAVRCAVRSNFENQVRSRPFVYCVVVCICKCIEYSDNYIEIDLLLYVALLRSRAPRATGARAAEARPTGARAAEARATEARTTEARATEARATEARAIEIRVID